MSTLHKGDYDDDDDNNNNNNYNALSSVVSVLGLSNLFTSLKIIISRTKFENSRVL
jgi:hypothetical protein